MVPRARPGSRRDMPAYPVTEAAGYVRVAPATLRSWVMGRAYATRSGTRRFHPLIMPADRERRLLSFNNLVEAHVLRALRTTHGTAIPQIRKALDYAERELGVGRLLLSPELCTDSVDLFLDRYGELINLSRSGQLAMKAMLTLHLKRIERDEASLPMRLYPFVHGETVETPHHIAIDPDIGFGRPIIRRRGVATQVIVDRIDAGETVEEIAEDYGLDHEEVEEAILYERAA